MNSDLLTSALALVGHDFAEPDLLARALTHSSADAVHNEGLAMVGDRIHNLWVARQVWSAMPDAKKGVLTEHMNDLSDKTAQAAAFRACGLESHLQLGGSVKGQGGRVEDKMASTAWEAVLAALDADSAGGQAAVDAFLERTFRSTVDRQLAPAE